MALVPLFIDENTVKIAVSSCTYCSCFHEGAPELHNVNMGLMGAKRQGLCRYSATRETALGIVCAREIGVEFYYQK